jgi:hypothetical protein
VLGRTLGDDARSRDALSLAWSKPDPEPKRVTELVEAVEERT